MKNGNGKTKSVLEKPPVPTDRLTAVRTVDKHEYHLGDAIANLKALGTNHPYFAGYIGVFYIDGSIIMIPEHKIEYLHFTAIKEKKNELL